MFGVYNMILFLYKSIIIIYFTLLLNSLRIIITDVLFSCYSYVNKHKYFFFFQKWANYFFNFANGGHYKFYFWTFLYFKRFLCGLTTWKFLSAIAYFPSFQNSSLIYLKCLTLHSIGSWICFFIVKKKWNELCL